MAEASDYQTQIAGSEVSIPTAARRSQFRPNWAFLALGLLIVLLAMAGVVTLQNRSGSSRQAEVLIARVEGLSNQLKRLELEAESEGHLTPELDQQARALRVEMARDLDELQRLDRGGEASLQVLGAYRQYQAANEELFRLFAAGDEHAAHEWDEEHSDPAYDTLFAGMTSASGIYRAAARQAILGATVGSSLTLVMAAVLIGLLFLRFERAQRTADLLATEQRTLSQSEKRFRALVKNASDVIVIIDARGRMHYQSPGAERLWGYSPAALNGRDAWEFVHAEDLPRALNLLAKIIKSPGATLTTELRTQHANGAWRDFEVIATNLIADPDVGGIVVTYHDITERKAFEAELTHLTFHDPLSNLPNRALAMDRLARGLARAERRKDAVAVLCLDLDNFKMINDSLVAR